MIKVISQVISIVFGDYYEKVFLTLTTTVLTLTVLVGIFIAIKNNLVIVAKAVTKQK
ncbi:MAG: hypothetical protein FD167_1245 [bacterium]|nr:MAG: hypothetical protein FD167_1245 [bacterium]